MWQQHLQQLGIDCKQPISRVVTHSSQVQPGDVFVAINSGWQYVDEALSLGAVKVISSREHAGGNLRVVEVDDTTQWLIDLARLHRLSLSFQVIGVTGSVGKTSLTQLLKQVLQYEFESHVVVTEGNQNNELGVALTILAADASTKYLVVEMGVAKPGDMDVLMSMVEPDISVITRVGPSHLEGLGSRQGVLNEKQKIGVGAAQVVLHDSIDVTPGNNMGQVRRFGTTEGVDVWIDKANQQVVVKEALGEEVHRVVAEQGYEHRLETYAAVTAVCLCLGVKPNWQEMGEVVWPQSRMSERHHRSGAVIIDDAYNANPLSYRVALQYMQGKPKALLVLGEMGGLGDKADVYHGYLGHFLNYLGFESVWLIGEAHQATLQTYLGEARWFQNIEELKDALVVELYPGRHVLVKGSRHLKLEALFQ